MRVLYLTDRVERRGGAARHLLQVVRWAGRAEHRVTVAAGRVETGLLERGVTVERMPVLASRLDSHAGLSGLERLVASADVVHLQNVMNPSAIDVATQGGRAVVTVQDHRVFCPGPGKTLPDGTRCRVAMGDDACSACLPAGTYRSQLLDVTRARLRAVRRATVVVLSRYMADELASAGVPDAAVIPPFVEVSRGEPEPGDAFLLAGRLVAHKAPRDGWEAWRRCGCRLPLRVAGDGREADSLAGAKRLGWLAPDELTLELRRSRALLFPSRWQEPFGIVGVESLAQATPVVAARSGGTDEWTDEGCVVVERSDVDAMASALARLAADPEWAMALGRAGREMVAARFSRAVTERRLQQLYEAVANRGRPPG